MHRGYTKRWRKRWDKGYHTDNLLWIMMDYFIDFATYKDKEFPFIWKGALVEMVKLKRGQCFFTIKGLRDFFNSPLNPVSRKMVRRRLKILDKIKFLEHKQGRHYQIVTICNYDKYNPLDECEGHQQAHQSPINGTSIAHQSATTNKDKEYKKEIKEIKGASWFDSELWNQYKKQRKKMTVYAELLALRKLVVWNNQGEDPKQIITQSIENGWRGLFPKNKKGGLVDWSAVDGKATDN